MSKLSKLGRKFEQSFRRHVIRHVVPRPIRKAADKVLAPIKQTAKIIQKPIKSLLCRPIDRLMKAKTRQQIEIIWQEEIPVIEKQLQNFDGQEVQQFINDLEILRKKYDLR